MTSCRVSPSKSAITIGSGVLAAPAFTGAGDQGVLLGKVPGGVIPQDAPAPPAMTTMQNSRTRPRLTFTNSSQSSLGLVAALMDQRPILYTPAVGRRRCRGA